MPPPLELLCACLIAGQAGDDLDEVTTGALLDPSADLVGLARLAGRHLVTPMVATCIARGALRQQLPEDFSVYLDFVYSANERRNRALWNQLREIGLRLNGIGVEPVLLKGAIRLVDQLYPSIGWRFMRDLDLLLPRDRLSAAAACLESIGYGFCNDAKKQEKHLPQLRRDDDVGIVELHVDLLSRRQDLCSAEAMLVRSRLVDLDGARVRIPQIADQLIHLIGHDRFDGYLRRSGMFLLRSVFETALLCRDERHVRQLLARLDGTDLAPWAGVQLHLASRLFPQYLPRPPAMGMICRVRTQALIALERTDQDGRLRRLIWFTRLRAGKLLTSPADRRYLADNLSLGYLRRCISRLQRLWASD